MPKRILCRELIQFSSFVVSKYAVGKAREVKSGLTQPNTGNSQRNRRNIGLPVQDFKIISTHSLIRETKQIQSIIKKSAWIIDHYFGVQYR